MIGALGVGSGSGLGSGSEFSNWALAAGCRSVEPVPYRLPSAAYHPAAICRPANSSPICRPANLFGDTKTMVTTGLHQAFGA